MTEVWMNLRSKMTLETLKTEHHVTFVTGQKRLTLTVRAFTAKGAYEKIKRAFKDAMLVEIQK